MQIDDIILWECEFIRWLRNNLSCYIYNVISGSLMRSHFFFFALTLARLYISLSSLGLGPPSCREYAIEWISATVSQWLAWRGKMQYNTISFISKMKKQIDKNDITTKRQLRHTCAQPSTQLASLQFPNDQKRYFTSYILQFISSTYAEERCTISIREVSYWVIIVYQI
jgi:hypothetical protein